MRALKLLAALPLLALLLAADLPRQVQIEQSHNFVGALAAADPVGDIYFVDATNGNDGYGGESKIHPVQTLTRALALAGDGDTIILAPGGSETLTTGLTVSEARLRIVCPTLNPDSGFTLTGAGTLNLITVSGADVDIRGIKLVHTGATADQAGILTTAAADRLHVENCVFDDSAIVTTFTGAGVEITDDCDDVEIVNCRFKDLHRSILFATAGGKAQIDSRISGCVFWVGQATAFGIHASPTGTVRGMEVRECLFRELDGDGSTATDAWDGTDGTNATSGPILFGANTDQYTISGCYAETALTSTFDNLNAINAGAVGALMKVSTGDGETTNITLSAAVGTSVNSTTTDSINGKIGTDTEMADVSLYDMLGANTAATTDSINGKLGTDTEMADVSLYDMLAIGAATGDADIDISESDYTTYITLLTVAAPAGGLRACRIDIDVNKATTGLDAISTAADTFDAVLVGQVDGTNYRTLINGTQIVANGDETLEASESGWSFNIGPLQADESVQVRVKLSVERADAELPYRVTYQGVAPTVTPVAAL